MEGGRKGGPEAGKLLWVGSQPKAGLALGEGGGVAYPHPPENHWARLACEEGVSNLICAKTSENIEMSWCDLVGRLAPKVDCIMQRRVWFGTSGLGVVHKRQQNGGTVKGVTDQIVGRSYRFCRRRIPVDGIKRRFFSDGASEVSSGCALGCGSRPDGATGFFPHNYVALEPGTTHPGPRHRSFWWFHSAAGWSGVEGSGMMVVM